MAGMRAVHKKNGTTFKYSGDLKETIEKAEKELKEKEGTTQWLFLNGNTTMHGKRLRSTTADWKI